MRDRADPADIPGCVPLRRCILPVDGFYEWKAIKGQRAKQPYAIAMKDGTPFGIAGLWENWKDPASGEWIRTFAVITTDANEMVAEIHDRMPAILAPEHYTRWLSDEPDPRDLMRPFPADLMRIWPISTRVNKPENDEPSILEPIKVESDAALARGACAPSGSVSEVGLLPKRARTPRLRCRGMGYPEQDQGRVQHCLQAAAHCNSVISDCC